MITISYITYLIMYYLSFNMLLFVLITIIAYSILKYNYASDKPITKNLKIIESSKDSHFIIKGLDLFITINAWILFAPAKIILYFFERASHIEKENKKNGVK